MRNGQKSIEQTREEENTMISIDSTDLKILAELVENSKSSFADLGRKLHLHPNVIAYRVNKMEQAGIIKEYTVTLDLEKLGLSEQICIGANLPVQSEREEILQQIATIPQTVRLVSSLGTPESIVFLVGKNKAEVEKVLRKLQSMNIEIEYTASVIKTYQEGRLANFLKILAKEIDAPKIQQDLSIAPEIPVEAGGG